MDAIRNLLARLKPPEELYVSDPDESYDVSDISSSLTRVLTASPWKRIRDDSPVAVHFAIVKQPDPNAFVVESSAGIFLIAFHSGLLKSLMNVFARAAHHDVMFNEVADPGPSQGNDLFESAPLASDNQQRMLLATLLYRLALEFLFYHELHHLILGHAGYVFSKTARLRLFETGNSAALDPHGQRPMEYAADWWASKTLYDSVVRRRFVTLTPQSLKGFDNHHLLYGAALAFITLFAMLQYFDQNEMPTYPTVGARSLTFIHEWTRRIDKEQPISPDLWGHSATTALHAVRVAFTEAYGAVALMDFTGDDAAIDRAYAEITELAQRATDMSPVWREHAVRTNTTRSPQMPEL